MIVARWRRVARALIPALIVSLVAPVAAAQGPRSIPWWKSTQFQKDLGMTTEQVDRIEAIFEATLPELRAKRDELERLEVRLSTLIEADADEAAVARWVDKTEAARGSLNKLRTLMLMRMRQALTPEQRVRFKALHEQRDRGRHGPEARRQATPTPSRSGQER